jgi:hypothetical protein
VNGDALVEKLEELGLRRRASSLGAFGDVLRDAKVGLELHAGVVKPVGLLLEEADGRTAVARQPWARASNGRRH